MSDYLGLDLKRFDQTRGSGWRVLDENSDHVGAAQLIEAYIEEHADTLPVYVPGDTDLKLLHFHAGQTYASGGARYYEVAISHFKQSYPPAEYKRAYWNGYIDGTIAYLERDAYGLEKAITILQGVEENEEGMKGKTNLHLLLTYKGALQNQQYDYKTAYRA